LKHNQGESAITVQKRKFVLQICNNLFHNYSSTTCAKQITVSYSLFYNKGPF